MDNKIKNSGLIFEAPKPEDWVFKGVTGVKKYVALFPDGHGWLGIQRREQTQRNAQFDTFSCVTFSCLKALSYYLKKVYDIDVNFSERFTAVMSGTTPGVGNSIRNVLESIRNDGFLEEEDCPFTADMTEKEFFTDVTQAQKDKALANKANFRGLGLILIEWEVISNNPFTGGLVDHNDVKEALKYSPVITTGYAWSQGPIYVSLGDPNHCFLGAEWQSLPNTDLKADDNYPFDFGNGIEPDANYIKDLSTGYKLYSAYKITGTLVNGKKKTLLTTLLKKSMEDFYYYWDGKHNFFYVGVPARETNKFRQPIPWDAMTRTEKFTFLALRKAMNQSSWSEVSQYPDVSTINKRFA